MAPQRQRYNIFILKERGTNQGRRENTEDKQEHKPATKAFWDREKGYSKGISQKPIGPTPRKVGVGGTSNQGVLNHRRDRHQNHQSQQGLGYYSIWVFCVLYYICNTITSSPC